MSTAHFRLGIIQGWIFLNVWTEFRQCGSGMVDTCYLDDALLVLNFFSYFLNGELRGLVHL
jgi:hypothetical protein